MNKNKAGTNPAVRATPVVEVSVQNSEVSANDSSNVSLSHIATPQLQDLLATVMAATRLTVVSKELHSKQKWLNKQKP